MNTKQNNNFWRLPGRAQFGLVAIAFALLLQIHSVSASETAIESLQFTALAGNKVQLQLEMNEAVPAPKVFQTDNPARIALDFSGVKSHLSKKSFPINQGAAGTVYVVEAGGRTRVVINLTAAVDYQTKTEGNKYYVVLNAAKSVAAGEQAVKKQLKQTNISKLIPQQNIKSIDFRRGPHGEGRLLLGLSNPNTVVDVKEKGGKVVLNFINTRLPETIAKSYDVIDFATPVKRVDAGSRGSGANITVTTVDANFEYSTFQAEGLLTVEFRPITVEEKTARLKDKFPYTGEKLSLNFQDIEVRSVLQILADFTDLNIIASDSVGGTVTLRLNDVPWDQALALVLKSKGLAKRESGNVVFVAPATEITKMEEEELAANKIVKELEPLVTEYIQINYAKAEDFSKMLLSTGRSGAGGAAGAAGAAGAGAAAGQSVGGSVGSNIDERRLISTRGTVIVDTRTNTLIVKDTAERLVEIRKMITLLDIPVRQVLIESRIVIASTGFAQELGVRFGVAQKADINGGKQFGFTGTGLGDDNGNGINNANILADLGTALAASSGGSLAMTLARGADYVLNLEISALQDDLKGELLSNPRVMTTDRVQATIEQGVQIPYQTQSQDGPVTQLVDAVLQLDVTPQITPSGSVIMELAIKKDAPGTPITTNGQLTLPIETRSVNTTVQVEDGETVVLGGIYESESTREKNTVPWLADLPGIGWLFRRNVKDDTKRELLVFVTPKIVKPSLSAY